MRFMTEQREAGSVYSCLALALDDDDDSDVDDDDDAEFQVEKHRGSADLCQ